MLIFYNLFIQLYALAIRISALFNPKAQKWLAGRKRFFRKLKQNFPQAPQNLIWFHSSSLGEFEQARPFIEKIKTEQPEKHILVTFFSSSFILFSVCLPFEMQNFLALSSFYNVVCV